MIKASDLMGWGLLSLLIYVYFKSFFHKTTNWGGIQYIVSEKGDMKVDKKID